MLIPRLSLDWIIEITPVSGKTFPVIKSSYIQC